MKTKTKRTVAWAAGIILSFGVIAAAVSDEPETPSNDSSFGGGRDYVAEQTVQPNLEPDPDTSPDINIEPEPDKTPSPSKTVEPEPEPEQSQKPTADQHQTNQNQSPQYKYVASIESNKYHKPTCRWTDEIKPENLIYFDTVEQAQNAGYTACGTYKPR